MTLSLEVLNFGRGNFWKLHQLSLFQAKPGSGAGTFHHIDYFHGSLVPIDHFPTERNSKTVQSTIDWWNRCRSSEPTSLTQNEIMHLLCFTSHHVVDCLKKSDVHLKWGYVCICE